MARKGKQKANNHLVTLESASEELASRLVKLYKAQSFLRSGKDLADMLFQTGVEAGAALSGIADIPLRQAKLDAANRAIVKLKQLSYIANVMCMAELYKPEQVKSVIEYSDSLVGALRKLLTATPEEKHVYRIKNPLCIVDNNPVKQRPVIMIKTSAPVAKSAPVTAAAVESANEIDTDTADGFNDPA